MKLLFLFNVPMALQCIHLNDYDLSVQLSLIWAVTMVVVAIALAGMILFYLDNKDERRKSEADRERKHEEALKEQAYEREMEWAQFEETKASTDEALTEKVRIFEGKVKDLEAELNHQKKVNDLLSELVKKYEESMPKLKDEPKSQDEQKDDTSNKKE